MLRISLFILNNFHSPVAILLIINLFLLIVGMVMDTTPAILILTPILLPIVQAIGMDPIQFGVIMVVNLAIGFVTPPIGVNLFVASSLTDVPVMAIAKKAMPMIIFFLAALLLITFIPAISIGILWEERHEKFYYLPYKQKKPSYPPHDSHAGCGRSLKYRTYRLRFFQ